MLKCEECDSTFPAGRDDMLSQHEDAFHRREVIIQTDDEPCAVALRFAAILRDLGFSVEKHEDLKSVVYYKIRKQRPLS